MKRKKATQRLTIGGSCFFFKRKPDFGSWEKFDYFVTKAPQNKTPRKKNEERGALWKAIVTSTVLSHKTFRHLATESFVKVYKFFLPE